jgi:hypothetical protein
MMAISTVALATVFVLLAFGQLRASKDIHTKLIDSVLRAPLRFTFHSELLRGLANL